MLQFAELQPNLNMYVLFNYLKYSVLNTHIVEKLNINSLSEKKNLNFDEIQFIEFSFMDRVLVSYLRILPGTRLQNFSLMFSSEVLWFSIWIYGPFWVKESSCNAGGPGLIPGSGNSCSNHSSDLGHP